MSTQIATKELVAGIDEITLAHMQLKIEPDEFLMADGLYAGKKLAIYLVQRFYEREVARIEKFSSSEKPVDTATLKRALSLAKWNATNHASNTLPAIVDSSVYALLNDAERSGWYHDVDEEFDTLEEMLSSIVEDAEEQTPKFYNYSFLLKEIVPLARSFNIDPDALWVGSSQAKKVKYLVPAARELLTAHKENKLSTKKAKEELKWMLEMAANKDVTASHMKLEMEQYRNISSSKEPIQGNVFLLEQGRSLMVIEIGSQREHRAIERALIHKVDFRFGHIGELLRLLLPEDAQEKMDADKLFKTLRGG